jgi:hypothetical protein
MEQAVVRGSELLKHGKVEEAQRAFRSALEIEPDNARVLALLGLSHFRANELGEARPIYEQLVERSPGDASHRLNLGLVYLKLNDADRAIESLEASRAIDPSQGRAVSYLGLAYARAGRYAEAYRAFLVAGQNDLAIEIEINLSGTERDLILAELGRPPGPPIAARAAAPGPAGRFPTPAGLPVVPDPARITGQHAAWRAATPLGTPRTKPPSAPPAKSRTPSQDRSGGDAVSDLARELESSAPGEPAAANPAAASPAAPDPVSPAALRAGAAQRAPRQFSESMQFVMPRVEPGPARSAPDAAPGSVTDASSMISRAVASASPTPTSAIRTRSGGTPPRPLSELATDDLVRPDEGDDAFEISGNGALIIRVTERVMTRLDGVHVTGGDLGFELATRRSRGHNTETAFDYGGSQLYTATGRGYMIAVPGAYAFSAVSLDDDILYLREDLVFAFQISLRWENGNVPGLRGKLPVVQFRGHGALALRLARPLVRVKLPAQGLVFIAADRLAGWIGRVIPRAVVPPPGGPLGAMCVECTGEGVVLVEPAPLDPPAGPAIGGARTAPASEPPAEPPPPGDPAVDSELASFAADLAEDADAAAEADAARRRDVL